MEAQVLQQLPACEQLSGLSDAEGLLRQTLTGPPAPACMAIMSTYQRFLMHRDCCEMLCLAQNPPVQHVTDVSCHAFPA